MELSILENRYFIGIGSAVLSIFITVLIQRILNRRGRIKYYVTHNQVGMSTDDAAFGSVRVTWNGTEIANLYLSTIELVNDSLRDYTSIRVRVFSNDTNLLSERTEIVGTTQNLNWTEEFASKLHFEKGEQPSEDQYGLAIKQRDYFIHTFNRGQIVRFTFLNAALTQDQPNIWLDMLHPGLRLRYVIQHNKYLGVSQPLASLVGLIVGLVIVLFIVKYVKMLWIIGIISFFVGLVAQLPGAIIIKLWRWMRDVLGG